MKTVWLLGAGYWGTKLQTVLAQHGVEARVIDTRNGHTLQDITDLEPVMIATPLWQHHEQCQYLLQRGHDVYVEKPMATTAAEVQELAALVGSDQIFMVGHLFQHHPQRDEIHTLINTGFIGDLMHIHSERLNWGIYQTRTDPVLSLGTHDISIICDFCSDHPEVLSVQRYTLSDNLQPDRVTFSGRSGAVTWSCDVSWAWPRRSRQTVFLGTQGQIVWDQDANSYAISRHSIQDRKAVTDTQIEQISYSHIASPLEAEIAHWIKCVRDRTMPSTGWPQALKVAQVIDQIKKL